MASGPTPRRRNPKRSGEPVAGAQDDTTLSPKSEQPAGSAGLDESALEPAAAESAPVPKADAAVAAASAAAAAAAAAAAVSAAIAATAATKATRAGGATAEATAGATAQAEGVAKTEKVARARSRRKVVRPETVAEVAVTAELPAAALPLDTAPPLAPETPLEPEPVAQPLSVQGYVRAPARDVAGLTRAEHVEDGETAAPFPATGPTTAAALPATEALDGAPGGSASTGGDNGNGPSAGIGSWRDTRVFASLAALLLGLRAAATWLGAALAVVLLPIVLGLGRLVAFPGHAISGWVARRSAASTTSTASPVSPDFDEYGNPRKKQRITPFWLAFGGFYLILALIIGGTWATTVMQAASTDRSGTPAATPTPSIAGGGVIGEGSPSASPSPLTSATPKAVPSVVAPDVSTPTPTPTPTATPTPTPTPVPTPKPTPVPTPKPTPVPTPKPTPVPTPTPTPTPTPKPTPTPSPTPFVPSITPSVASPQAATTPVNFIVKYTVGWNCTLTRTYVSGPKSPQPTPGTLTGTQNPPGTFTFTTHTRDAGIYTITATCSLSGASASSSISYTWT